MILIIHLHVCRACYEMLFESVTIGSDSIRLLIIINLVVASYRTLVVSSLRHGVLTGDGTSNRTCRRYPPAPQVFQH